MRLIDADALKQHYNVPDAESVFSYCDTIMRVIDEQPTIEPEVRHGKGCKFCNGRSYTKKPLTVITRTMKHVEVVFEYCPACGRKMDGGADNG